MSVDIKAIRWLLDNATAYAISKNCGVSIQAVDKYKNGVSDIRYKKNSDFFTVFSTFRANKKTASYCLRSSVIIFYSFCFILS